MGPAYGHELPRDVSNVRCVHNRPSSSVVWWGIVFIIFLALVLEVHHAGFTSPMLYDSFQFLAEKEHIFEQGGLIQAMGILPRRPLTMATFYGNYLLTGMEPAAFRFTNAVLLAVTGLLVVSVTAIVLAAGRPGATPDSDDRRVAFLGGLLFVLHPLQTYVVLYVWQREALLACLFFSGGLLVYLALRTGRLTRPGWGYGLTSLLYLLGLLSKENVVTLPLALFLAELILLRAPVREALRRGTLIAALTVPVLIMYGLLTHFLHVQESLTARGMLEQLQRHFAVSGITVWEMLLTECRVLFSYLASIVAPLPGHVLLCKAQVISRSLTEAPMTLAACAGVVGLVVTGLMLIRSIPAVAFGLLFFFTTLIPESVLIPQYLFFGYRAILPMIGVILIGAWFARQVLMQAQSSRVPLRLLVWFVAIATAAYFGAVTSAQSARWNPICFWAAAWSALPPISRDVETVPLLDILGNYGGALVDAGDCARAIQVLEPALQGPVPWQVRQSAAVVDSEDSTARADNLIREKTDGLWILLGKAYRRSGRVSDAVALFQRELQRSPGSALLHNSLGLALSESGRVADAIASYQQAIAIDPGLAEAHNNLGSAYMDSGRHAEAIDQFRRALEVDPRFALAHMNLGLALVEQGKLHEGIRHCLRAVELDPNHKSAMEDLKNLLERLNGGPPPPDNRNGPGR